MRRLLLLVSVACLWATTAFADEARDYCLRSIGDIDGDGVADLAASADSSGRSSGTLVHIIRGGGEPLPPRYDAAVLNRRAIYALHGIASIPFTCPLPVGQTFLRRPLLAGAAARRLSLEPRFTDSPVNRPVFYRAIDLNPLTPGYNSVASGISASGQVVGDMTTAEGQDHAFLYDGSTFRDLGTLGGHFSTAYGNNSRGQVVGYSLTGETDSFGFVSGAFLFDNGVMREFGLSRGIAYKINEAGQIVGAARISDSTGRAVLYDKGEVTDLGSIDGTGSSGASLNDRGDVVGESGASFIGGIAYPDRSYRSSRGFLFQDGTLHDLGSLGHFCGSYSDSGTVTESCYERSAATDINNRQQIVGFSSTPAGAYAHATLIAGGAMQDLGTLGGLQSWAYAINDSGQVVGTSLTDDDKAYAPFLYEGGQMYDLRQLILDSADPGLFGAVDINNFGQIVGSHHLLNPVYESVRPGERLSFSDTLGPTMRFEYWVKRESADGCSAGARGVQVQVRLDGVGPGQEPWVNVDGGRMDCSESTDWARASFTVPTYLQGTTATIRIRIRELGLQTGATVYLRHFTMK